MAEEYELGTVGPIPTVNPNVAKIGEMLKIAKKYADQYYVKDYVPLIGGMTLGDFLLGQAPEEVERIGQGNYPFRNPATVVGTGGNRLDVFKTGRFEPVFDVIANVALPAAGTAQMVSRPLARSLGPKAAEMAEDYLTRQGAIANIVEPSPVRATEQFSKIDELGFHSPLENAILKIQQSKGTGEQFLKQLEKTPGVKTEELDVTGIKQYLLDHPTVTKQELLDQMATSRVKLEQKVLPKQKEITNNEADYEIQGGDIYHDDDYIRSMADDLHNDLKTDEVIRAQEREALLKADPERYVDHNTNPYVQAKLEEDIDNVLFEQAKTKSEEMYYESPIRSYYDDYGYEIHGNDEMGYSVRGPNGEHVDLGNNIYDIADVTHELRMHHLDRDILDYTGNEEDFAKYADYVLPGQHENYREILTTLPSQSAYDKANANLENFWTKVHKEKPNADLVDLNPQELAKYDELNNIALKAERTVPSFESSHFDEFNILAHTRVNDRIINGKKTLFVEEIQSDWHQAGRKKGYQGGGLTTAEKAEYDALQKEADALMQRKDLIIKNLPPEKMDRMRELSDKKAMEKNGVPDAPYKKNWHELMMKQVFNEAVKGNYDAVAFTTGKQQADRYNLAKHIDELMVTKNPDNTFSLEATMPNNGGIHTIGKSVPLDKLEDFVGKDLAKKIEKQESTGDVYTAKDLTVGGEPMKKFYDEIIPNFVNNYGKKYGIGVKKANLPSERMPSQEAVNDYFKSINMSRQDFEKLSLDERAKILGDAAPKGDEVHFIELSDMAKKDIKEKGQPLFSGIGLAPAPLLMNDEDN